MFSTRALRWAFVVSVCAHLVLLLTGQAHWPEWLGEHAEEEAISARILPPPPPPKPKKAKPAKPAVASPLPSAPSSEAIATSGTASAAAPGAALESVPAVDPGRVLPASGRMRFSVTKGDAAFIVGRAVHDWQVENGRYELRSLMETAGIVALFVDVRLGQISSGRVDAEGLHPETFLDNRKDGQHRSEFDWGQGRLVLSNGTVAPLSPGAQDLLSMIYQFGLYPLDGPELSLMVATGRKFERYTFRIERDVPLWLNRATDDAPIQTYHLSYRGRDAEGVEVWLARDMDRLPVKIRYTDRKGGVTEMTAEQVDYPGKP